MAVPLLYRQASSRTLVPNVIADCVSIAMSRTTRNRLHLIRVNVVDQLILSPPSLIGFSKPRGRLLHRLSLRQGRCSRPNQQRSR